MAAPRSTSLRALRLLSQQHRASPSLRRGLHITGANSAQPARVSDKVTLWSTRSLADLKSECQKRSLGSTGTQAELVERLSNHDFLQSRAFSIAMRRINSNAKTETPSRQFNTSRSQKAVNDSSTVDFVYMPSIVEANASSEIPVPILPDIYTHHNLVRPSGSPMKPQVYTVAGDGANVSASPMTEVVDNHSVDIDPFSLTEAVGKSRLGEELKKQQKGEHGGVVQELWTGFLDDLLGPKQQSLQK
ncbi:hypothetical protein P175DRAFT_0446472 [Aspergillus ochraceoroseus IBT 24754]|uniref:SAP domain-containing protein n=3 Tax=Aspergillus subgen. Nidulantes TaxID=2720870 RepID=A0A0F8V5B6_9EURO|nr:uncharacterized protein P175DRAFT_0446472 [Aspergillus ochraceoroseus IBT 24754]KKK14674.1 hypothetical protein AOCH_000803 [Aspergillus ochraceoroseus]KKK26989.1 hypothetical protein ARAM_002622 [Aspergillus rambellii]PTU17322.1 hypothetical protein P175DRAFT_0446472 [Aspergillus ochraceoroseus IBT 24754]